MRRSSKIIAMVMSAVITASLPVMHMHANENYIISSDDSRYKYLENEDGTISVAASEYSKVGLSGDIKIPEMLDGRTVTGICKSGFNSIPITGVTIPDTVTSIAPLAFANCLSLSTINIPDTVTSIGEIVFSNTAFETKLLKEADPEFVIINDNILYLYTGSQRDVEVPDGISVIANSAFANNENLASVTLPDGVKHIGSNAFEKCPNLKKMIIKTGLESVGENAIDKSIAIYGYTGTYAETFAKENGNPFAALVKEGDYNIECEYDENFKQYYYSTDTEFSKEGIHIFKRYEDGTKEEITDSIEWDFSSTPKELYAKAHANES